MEQIDSFSGVRTVAVAAVSLVAGGALAAEGLALQRDALGRGVAVVAPSVAGVDQLRPGGPHCWGGGGRGEGGGGRRRRRKESGGREGGIRSQKSQKHGNRGVNGR